MKDKKININRTKVTSAEIEEKRNFDQLMLQLKTPPNPYYSSIGFWGKTGMAGLVILFVVKSITSLFSNFNEETYEENFTLNQIETNLPEDTRCLTPISADNDIPFEYHEVISGEFSEIKLKDGTIIEVPANAFKAENGEKVQISTRLFTNKTSAFLAGVPMDYQENAFESAGMLELRGEINGKVAEINPDAPIVIHLNMYKHPEGFDFFALDDASGEWSLYPADFNTKMSHDEEVSDKDIDILKSDIDEIVKSKKIVNNRLSQLKMPKEEAYFIAKNDHLQFKLDFDVSKFPELKSFKSLVFEALPNQYNYSNVVRSTWDDFKIKKEAGQYIATFLNDRETESLKVRPVVKGKELEKALRDFEDAKRVHFKEQTSLTAELETLQQLEKEKSERIKALAAMKEQEDILSPENPDQELTLMRQMQAVQSKIMNATATFKTKKWGVFNADKPVAYPKELRSPVNLVAENHTMDDIDKAYVFDMKKDVRYTFGSVNHTLKSFGLNNNTTIIMVVYKNGDIGYSETTRSELEESNGKLELTPLSADEISEEKIKAILHEGRFSA